MKLRILAGVVMAAALAACAGLPGTVGASVEHTAGAACDRKCMNAAVDRYLLAMLDNDRSLAPLGGGFRATENGQISGAGQGLWLSSDGLGPLQRRYFDLTAGQAALYGVVMEGSERAIVSMRFGFDGDKIVEAETIVARKNEPLYNIAGTILDQPRRDDAIAPKLRASREEMIATASAYFDALEGGDPDAVPHVDGCERVENGTRVTHRMRPGAQADGDHADEMMSGDCLANFGNFSIAAIAHRRFPVVDTEAGVILGVGLFQRPEGAVDRSGQPRKRNLIHEYFALEDGAISEIFAAMRYRDHDEPDGTGWQ